MKKTIPVVVGFIMLVRFSECCDCKNKEMSKEKSMKHNSKLTMGKRQLHETEYETSDVFEYGAVSDAVSTTTKKVILNETHFEMNETEFSTEIIEDKKHCPFYKKSPDLDMAKMIDVWRLVFYRSSVNLGCFKVLIKKLGDESRQFYQEKYGHFNDSIRWNDCILQLTSNGDGSYETHFLQAVENCTGLLANIIMSEENNGSLSVLTLQDHSPDQWLALDKLLLMRDCDNGDVIIFSKIPNNPSKADIDAALTLFGEDNRQGTWACREKNEEHLRNPKYQIIS